MLLTMPLEILQTLQPTIALKGGHHESGAPWLRADFGEKLLALNGRLSLAFAASPPPDILR
ncbi:hypothetical protein EGJ29_14215 [Pseudomonas sp. s199]|nr:hypothetical protein EGJ29_14215 [Pseudomonas sp. s199]